MTDEEIDRAEAEYGHSPLLFRHVGTLVASLAAPIKQYVQAEIAKALAARPEVRYCGVWTQGVYAAGSLVTRSGGLWLATLATSDQPGDGATSWKLVVKAGRA